MVVPTAKRINTFWAQTKKIGDCIIWTGATCALGYGKSYLMGKQQLAHRISWYFKYGEYPKLTLDHLCRNPSCVNVAHLEDVTHKENVLRGKSPSAAHAKKTHCDNGHKFSIDNTYIRSCGGRKCKECDRKRKREAYRKKAKLANGA